MTTPVRPIEFGGTPGTVGERLPAGSSISPTFLDALAAVCPTTSDAHDRDEHGRDWWPLAMHWALGGSTVTKPEAVCRPRSTEEVAHVMRLCADAHVAITPGGGRSGVCGAAVPLRGGVALDMTSMHGLVDVDVESGIACVLPGTFGPALEDELRTHHGLTVGHFPQSFALSTVGGWVASNGAGQFSTRYGSIAEMVAGLEVVAADGSVATYGPHPASATGPDIGRLFVGSEGTLGVITKVWLRCHPVPEFDMRATYVFPTFEAGIAAMRDAVRHGATPAVLRLYDAIESARNHGGDGTNCTLLVLDEGHPSIVGATMEVVAEFATRHGGRLHDGDRVASWLEHRNDTEALQALTRRGFIVDTMEVAAAWSALRRVENAVKSAASTLDGIRVASCHQSHSYLDGGCLYFTFVLQPPDSTVSTVEAHYVRAWDALQRAALGAGATVTHHHGIGLNRSRFMRDALGNAYDTWTSVKHALDPRGLLNPGKLGDNGSPWP
jgi:alkyldihydroxyacetonephosphate synthase